MYWAVQSWAQTSILVLSRKMIVNLGFRTVPDGLEVSSYKTNSIIQLNVSKMLRSLFLSVSYRSFLYESISSRLALLLHRQISASYENELVVISPWMVLNVVQFFTEVNICLVLSVAKMRWEHDNWIQRLWLTIAVHLFAGLTVRKKEPSRFCSHLFFVAWNIYDTTHKKNFVDVWTAVLLILYPKHTPTAHDVLYYTFTLVTKKRELVKLQLTLSKGKYISLHLLGIHNEIADLHYKERMRGTKNNLSAHNTPERMMIIMNTAVLDKIGENSKQPVYFL